MLGSESEMAQPKSGDASKGKIARAGRVALYPKLVEKVVVED